MDMKLIGNTKTEKKFRKYLEDKLIIDAKGKLYLNSQDHTITTLSTNVFHAFANAFNIGTIRDTVKTFEYYVKIPTEYSQTPWLVVLCEQSKKDFKTKYGKRYRIMRKW